MNAEHLAYPWRKDLEKMEKFYVNIVDSLVDRISALETRIQYLERYDLNQKPQQSYNTYTSNSAGGQINPGQAGAISGQAWAGASSGVSGGSTLPISSSGRKK